MKIYLVTPKNPQSFWTYDRILPTLERDCIFPNLSMPTVAGLTDPEHEVILCDENVEEIDFDIEADIVGVTGYLTHKERIHEIVEAFRSRGRFVAVGGPYASLCSEELAGRCDALFVGEAEETWPSFLRDFAAGCCKTEYRPEHMPDLTRAPMPRFDLLDVSKYHALTIQFARGCPYNCEFCDIIVLYGCYRLGATQVFVVDDNFIGNKNLAKQLLREMAKWSREHAYPIDFNTEVSLNVSRDDELLQLLRDANFTTLFVGIESPRRESLLESGKTQNTREDLVESVRKIQSFGIQVQAGMIVGFDHDDPSIFEEQLCFIQNARIPVSMTGMLQALPQTPLHDRVSREGRLLLESGGDQFVLSNILPKQMTRLELYRGYRWLLEQLYDFRNYRRRTLAFLLNRGNQIQGGFKLRSGDLRRLARILRDTVLRANPRRAWFTLSLLGTSLLRRPSAFKEAVSFAIVHRAVHEYMRALVERLDAAIGEIEREAADALIAPSPHAPEPNP